MLIVKAMSLRLVQGAAIQDLCLCVQAACRVLQALFCLIFGFLENAFGGVEDPLR